MPRFREYVLKVNLADNAVHIVQFDPDAEMVQESGPQGRTYQAVRVLESDRPALLPLSQKLAGKILSLNLKGPTKLKIQRIGAGFETDYEVSKG